MSFIKLYENRLHQPIWFDTDDVTGFCNTFVKNECLVFLKNDKSYNFEMSAREFADMLNKKAEPNSEVMGKLSDFHNEIKKDSK